MVFAKSVWLTKAFEMPLLIFGPEKINGILKLGLCIDDGHAASPWPQIPWFPSEKP